jgi:ABC-type dipeptide/oligopeptide/nickel transport system permease component
MAKYIVRRILLTIPILFAILVVTFAFSHAMPGGPFDTTGNKSLPPHIRAQLEQQFNLDKPVFFNLPNDGLGPDTAWGETLVVKGYSDTGYESQTFPAAPDAGIRLFGEYHLEQEEGASNCVGAHEQPGWALISRREVCEVTGGNGDQTFTEVRTRWQIDWLDSQFWLYMSNVIRLDFGPSLNVAKIQENKQVTDDFKERIPVSMQLGIFSTIIGFMLGIPLGVIAAVYHNTLVDFGATFVAVIGQSIPAIVLAPLLISIFAVQLDWLPVADPLVWKDNPITWEYFSAVADNPRLLYDDPPWFSWDYIKALILPVLTIGTGMSAGIARMTRASLLQVLNEDYIRTARAKGLRSRGVLYIHALKNSLIPVATGVGGLIAGIVSGSFVIELIFSIPGMGVTFIDAVNARDYTTIMGVTIFFSTILIFGNILVDVLYTWLDPRIRFD